jgi:hypothetical protein
VKVVKNKKKKKNPEAIARRIESFEGTPMMILMMGSPRKCWLMFIS